MTNFEFYKDKLQKASELKIEQFAVRNGEIEECVDGECEHCEFNETPGDVACTSAFIEWLYKEHVEPIRLEKWEYDLLKVYADGHPQGYIDLFGALEAMKVCGYFRGIEDTDTPFKDILNRAEIIDYNTCDGCKYKDVSEDDGACRGCCRYYEEDLYESELFL